MTLRGLSITIMTLRLIGRLPKGHLHWRRGALVDLQALDLQPVPAEGAVEIVGFEG
jgi:hypothetical protein